MQAVTSANAEIARRRAQSVPRGVGCVHPISIGRASGARVWDVEGREYLDFVGGIGVLNLGHANPAVVAAIETQARLYTHLCFQVTSYEPYVEVAEALNRIAPFARPAKTLLLTTGSEATENAVKIARAYTGRPAVVAFHHGYHGRTLLALSMTGKNAPYKQNFGPFCGEIYHAPFPHALHDWPTPRALTALDDIFASTVAPDRVAAIIIEPVLGEGGFIPVPYDYLIALRAICDRYGIVMICDEIQSGFGRTGKRFAIEHSGVEPDLITVAKSLAGGMPLAAVVGKADIMDAPAPGGLGGTYAGNPVACAAALASIEALDEDLLARALAIGARVRSSFEAIAKRHPSAVVDVRGLGAMIGIEFGADRAGVVSRIIGDARERGVLLMPAGAGNVIRALVPLVIDDRDLAEALRRIEESCDHILLTAEVKENS
ncbi:MAG: aspartate aminotransferase family protein [Candidatus Eremiobacteraeota bacterium]|nr:aspartate aminotransferase family protein [Candidatus Eremiobacteraeota bacterium]